MRLEVNTNGAWRIVLRDLTQDQAERARDAVETLCELSHQTKGRIAWRLADGERTVTHIDSIERVWSTR